MLPYLSLAVDGLNTGLDRRRGRLDLVPGDAAANQPLAVTARIPKPSLDPEQLEVYGWESSLWRKLKGYLGF